MKKKQVSAWVWEIAATLNLMAAAIWCIQARWLIAGLYLIMGLLSIYCITKGKHDE